MLNDVQHKLTWFGPKLSLISKLPSPLGEAHIPFDLGEIPTAALQLCPFAKWGDEGGSENNLSITVPVQDQIRSQVLPGELPPYLSWFLKHHDPHKWSCLEEERGFPGGAGGKEPASQCRGLKETRVRSLGQEDPLEKGMATHSSILSWRIPWAEEPGGLPSIGSQRVRYNWSDLAYIACKHEGGNINTL